MNTEDIYDSESTICAISTPPGSGGIAVIRVSGPKSLEIVDSIWKGRSLREAKTHTAHLGEIIDPERPHESLDECVATLFCTPRSFTGEDTVEISVHGSRWIQRELINLLVRQGCRPALPGEFTRRALLNGRLDLPQAEAVADVIASSSRAAHRLAASQLKGTFSKHIAALRDNLLHLASLLELELDFSEEDVEFADRGELRRLALEISGEISRLHKSYSSGSAIKDGIPVAIAGATNAGKSSLLNRLLSDERAIVSDIHGTTRDTIEETLEVDAYLFRFIDTAGLRNTTDPIEQMGISRSRQAISRAMIIITVIDPTAPNPLQVLDDIEVGDDTQSITLINKSDIATISQDIATTLPGTVINASAKTGDGIDKLLEALTDAARQLTLAHQDTDNIIVTNARHAQALGSALESAAQIITSLDNNLPPELTAQHLRQTISTLSAITGTIPTPEILSNIFKSFCIG
ncbi:MAG: tRNA uridine-5-carboxymethylaminomethyl(34) synthesis GTPase MnmE, partial [Muribaculaceae bacterium]|nr:tRNA uridine-5-carboxymethylaminomethyl(34) synthesis GTPase MnmE [Muribaculaceae bacterium]